MKNSTKGPPHWDFLLSYEEQHQGASSQAAAKGPALVHPWSKVGVSDGILTAKVHPWSKIGVSDGIAAAEGPALVHPWSIVGVSGGIVTAKRPALVHPWCIVGVSDGIESAKDLHWSIPGA